MGRVKRNCERLCSRLKGKVAALKKDKVRANNAKRRAGLRNANTEMQIVQGKRTRVYHGRADKKVVALQNAADLLEADIEQILADLAKFNCPDCDVKLPDTSTDETEAPVTGATETEASEDVTDGGEELGGDGTDISGGTEPPLPDTERAPNPEDRPVDDPFGPPTVYSQISGAIERAGRTIEEVEGMTEDALIAMLREFGVPVEPGGKMESFIKNALINPAGTVVGGLTELLTGSRDVAPSDTPAGPGTSPDDVTSATDSSRPEVPAGVYPFEDENYRKWYATLSDDQKMAERKRIDKEFSNRGGGTDSAVQGSPDTAPTNIQVSNTQATEIENLNREVERLNNTGALAQPGDPNYDPEFAALGNTRVTDIGDSPLGSGIRSALGMGNAPSAGSQRQKEYLDNKRAELQQRRDEIIQRVADENNISLERAREFLGLTGDDQPLDGSIRVSGGSGDGTTDTPPTSVASAATQPASAPPRRRPGQGTVMASYNPVSKYGVNLFEARRKFK